MAISAEPATALDREFLGIRSRLLDLAAALDRIDRSADAGTDDPRAGDIFRSLEILSSGVKNRAEQIQMVFSKE